VEPVRNSWPNKKSFTRHRYFELTNAQPVFNDENMHVTALEYGEDIKFMHML
jgi:hypothetical protein